MEIFLLLLIILAIVGITLFIIYYMMTLVGHTNAVKMLQYGRDREYFIYEMLKSAFGGDRVIRNLYFPVITKEGVFDTEIDIICITRGGIVAIEVKGSKGLIETPKSDYWCQRHGKKVRYFKNPYFQNQLHVRAIKAALKNAGITNVPIYNYVVFTDLSVQFTHNYSWLLRSDKLLDVTERLDDKLTLKRRDIKNIAKVINYHRKSRHTTFKAKYKRENQRRIRNQ